MLFHRLFTFGIIFFLAMPLQADWGQTGHRAIGAIAQEHLSRKAQRQIDELLNGATLALVATYADEIKSDKKYDMYKPWHYINFPLGTRYSGEPTSEKGDIAQGIATCVTKLKSRNTPKEEKVFYLKLLVHLVGDLHQPLHIGQADDLGGNRFSVKWFGRKTNLHRVWDSQLIESYQMTYSELASNRSRLSSQQIAQTQKGSVADWIRETRQLTMDVYEHTDKDASLGYGYRYRYMDTLRGQLQKAGLRLAVLLNDIFK